METHVSSLRAIVCLGAFLWCPGLTEADGADWKVLREDSYGNNFSYDAASIKQTAALSNYYLPRLLYVNSLVLK